MKTLKALPGKFISRPFTYGLLTCVIACLVRQIFMDEVSEYTANWTAFLLPFILSLGAFVYFKLYNASLMRIGQLLQSSFMFGLAAGMVVGAFYYINVTIADPEYLEKTIDAASKSWTAKGYSKQAIAGQVELTDTFQNPLKWSLTLLLFYTVLATCFSFIVGYMMRKEVPSDVRPGNLEHA